MFIGGFQLTSTEKKTKVSLSEGVLLAACIKYRKIKDETKDYFNTKCKRFFVLKSSQNVEIIVIPSSISDIASVSSWSNHAVLVDITGFSREDKSCIHWVCIDV